MAERSKRFYSAILLLALALLVFLFAAIALSFLPHDLSDLEGRNEDGTATPPSRNIQKVLENADKQSIQVTLTEEEVNQWLAAQVQGSQEGALAQSVQFRGVWVRFKEGSAEFVFEREAFNRTHTIAMGVKIEQTISGNNQMSSNIDWPGGRLGQMPVPQGYLLLVMSSYKELAEVMAPEVASLKKLLAGKATVTFEEGKMILEPRDTGANLGI